MYVLNELCGTWDSSRPLITSLFLSLFVLNALTATPTTYFQGIADWQNNTFVVCDFYLVVFDYYFHSMQATAHSANSSRPAICPVVLMELEVGEAVSEAVGDEVGTAVTVTVDSVS